MAANIDGALTGHVFADFIHHLRSGQFPLTGIAAAGIILTSLAINRRLAAHHDSSNPALTRLYMLRDAQLWNHITFHPECSAIYAALD